MRNQQYINYSQNYSYHPQKTKSKCQEAVATAKVWRAKEVQSLKSLYYFRQPITLSQE